MGAIEAHVLDAVVSLDPDCLLDAGSHVLGDFTEDGDLTLDHLGLSAACHVAGDIADETLLGAFIPDAFPEGAWSVEVFGADLAEEADGLADEVAVNLVEIHATVLEGDGLDGGEVVGAGALVVEGHAAVALEVCDTVASAGAVDRKLLVVDANTVAVSIGVGEETGLENRVG